MSDIVAKFKVVSATNPEGFDYITLRMEAVYSSDPNSENYSWSKWTPSGTIHMSITNPNLYDKFVVGDEYMIDFTKVEKD